MQGQPLHQVEEGLAQCPATRTYLHTPVSQGEVLYPVEHLVPEAVESTEDHKQWQLLVAAPLAAPVAGVAHMPDGRHRLPLGRHGASNG